jgi:hypothetical protein
MKKSIFNWMMAIALVATPMVFVSCGSDDDDSSSIPTTDSEGTQAISYGMSISATSGGDQEGFRAASTTVQNTMFSALYQAFGKSYTPQGTMFPVFSFITDETKALNTLDATYAQIKDTDMKGGYLSMKFTKDSQALRNYEFGTKPTPNDTVTFENQQLNDQNFWIGNAVGKYVYTEKGVTVTGTQSEYNNEKYWSGFAISGRQENTFANITPDQYNSVVGGGYRSNNFLVVYDAYNADECIEFPEPLHFTGFKCTNSAYTYNSMKNGDAMVTPFTKDDWFTCKVICLGANGDTLKVKEIDLAAKGVAPNNKFYEDWISCVINQDGVKKVKFSFDSSQKNDWGSVVPSYMCVDNILFKKSK